jgi:hypothetical protein
MLYRPDILTFGEELSKDILHIVIRMDPININPKTAWWLQHKNDPNIVSCMREARRKYYYKNQEQEKKRGREYYYAKKALLLATPMPPMPPMLPANGN